MLKRLLITLFAASLSAGAYAGAWPTDNITTTNVDQPGDDPSQARAEIYTSMLRVKDVIGARGSANGVASLDASGLVPLTQIPATLTGKDADTVDGSHAGNAANNVLKLDASGLVPLANIPSPLTGKSADTLDGIDSTGFAILSSTNTFSASQLNNDTNATNIAGMSGVNKGFVAYNTANGPAVITLHRNNIFAGYFGLDTDNQLKIGGWSYGAAAYKVWNESNDGAGSGLDADLLDGLHASAFAQLSGATFSGTLGSTKACATGYTRAAPNICLKDTPSVVTATSGTFAIAAPSADAKAVFLTLAANVYSNNGVATRQSFVSCYADFGLSQFYGQAVGVVREFVATVAGTQIGSDRSYALVRLPSPGGNFYISTFFSDAQQSGTYTITGYID